MDEQFAMDIFMHFSEDLHPKMRKKMIETDHNSYYSVIVSNVWSSRRPIFHKKEDVDKYSFKELYEEMCDLFYYFDEGKKDALYNIFRLKNFINYKMQYGG